MARGLARAPIPKNLCALRGLRVKIPMRLSKRQQALHWRLLKDAMPLLMQGRETWTKAEEDAQRKALYNRALGEEKSLTKMDDDDFDLVLGALKAILEPDNL